MLICVTVNKKYLETLEMSLKIYLYIWTDISSVSLHYEK